MTSWATNILIAWVLLLSLAGQAALAASDDPLWHAAQQAYRRGDVETGHQHLKELVEKSAGNAALASICLEQMLYRAGVLNYHDPWVKYAAEHLVALERAGEVSANSTPVGAAIQVAVEIAILEGRLIEAVAELDRLARENPHHLPIRILRAKTHRRLQSSGTIELYDALRPEIDVNHPDTEIRTLSLANAAEFATPRDQLPPAIIALPVGSPIQLMAPDDPDGIWGALAGDGPQSRPQSIDRLYGKVAAGNDIVPWRDMTGLTQPARALDLHLRTLPAAHLVPLREFQSKRFESERDRMGEGEADQLAVRRRFPWARQTQVLILDHADRALWAGRPHAALRSYQDVLDLGDDPKRKLHAQVGYWAALAQIGDQARIEAAFQSADAKALYPWLGKPTAAEEIKAALLKSVARTVAPAEPSPDSLRWSVVRIPPVSLSSSNAPTMSARIDMQIRGNDLLISGGNLLAMYDRDNPASPRWAMMQPNHLDDQNHRDIYPGHIQPVIADGEIFSRWGYTSYPRGIVSIDRVTGRPRWTNEKPFPELDENRRRVINVPIGDVSLADGLMYYLQWNNRDDIRGHSQRRLGLACYDGNRRAELYNGVISRAGHASDLNARFERASYQAAIFGNRVTVHEGAVYSCSNSGLVARSDIRDGQTDWVHLYGHAPVPVGNLGAAPVIAGDRVIFMPRDSSRVFALDQRTGRLVWNNVLVLPRESLGIAGDLIIIRGQTSLVALDHVTGAIRWHLPVTEQRVVKAQLIGESIYLGSGDGLRRVSARTGQVLGHQLWPVRDQRVISFTVHEDQAWVVTDVPADDPRHLVGAPLNPAEPEKAAPLSFPLARAWSLGRYAARVAVPPPGSPIEGHAFVLSDGMLECISTSARGAVRWRRFAALHNAHFHFRDETVIVYERGIEGPNRVPNRVACHGARDGRLVWDVQLPLQIDRVIECGSVIVFADNRGRMMGMDAVTGGFLWDRLFGEGGAQHQVTGDQLNLFLHSFLGQPRHLKIDARTGTVLSSQTVTVHVASDAVVATPTDDGYLEVTTKPVKARHVRFTALSEVNGRGWASGAELHVIGSDSKNLARDEWQVTASNWERRYNVSPPNLIDDNPESWWHTEWKDRLSPHPHHVNIDMGKEQIVTGIRYLPAKIANSNGTIKDFQLCVSQDGKDWGQPIVQGMLVPRIRVENPRFVGNVMYFESRDQQTNKQIIYRYALDGKPASPLMTDARIIAVADPYLMIVRPKPEGETHVILRRDDPTYQMDLGRRVHFNPSRGLPLKGDRLVISEQWVCIVDLAKKQINLPYDEKNTKDHNRPGFSTFVGDNHLLKIVHSDKGQDLYLIDLGSGEIKHSTLADQTEPLRDAINQHAGVRTLVARDTLLVYDGWNLHTLITDRE